MNKQEALNKIEELKKFIENEDKNVIYRDLKAGQYFRFKLYSDGGIRLKTKDAYINLGPAGSAAESAAYSAALSVARSAARSAGAASDHAAEVTVIDTNNVQLTVTEVDNGSK